MARRHIALCWVTVSLPREIQVLSLGEIALSSEARNLSFESLHNALYNYTGNKI